MRKIKYNKIGTLSLVFGVGLISFFSCKKNTAGPVAAALKDSLQISSISPDSGAAGTVVTITGSNFDADPAGNTVTFNGVIATVVSNDTAQYDHTKMLQVRVPKKAGTGPITVDNKKFLVKGPDFTYISLVTVSTVAGGSLSGVPGSPGFADGPASSALFNNPLGLAIDASGNLYVADYFNNRIRKITPDGTVSTLAGTGAQSFADGSANVAAFYGPVGVAVDRQGNVYVTDSNNGRVRKITSGGMVSTLAGSAPGLDNPFQYLYGICVDTTENVFATDIMEGAIFKITPDGALSTYLQKTADYPWASDAITFDAAANLYFCNSHDPSAVMEIAGGWLECSLAGGGLVGFADGPGITAAFKTIGGLCADKSGNVWVADAGNHRIRVIQMNAGFATTSIPHFGLYRNTSVRTFAGSAMGYVDGDAKTAKFNDPFGIVMDAQGDLYVSDPGNNCIRKITIE